MINKNITNGSYGISINHKKEILFQIQNYEREEYARIRLTIFEAEMIIADLQKWIERSKNEKI